MLPRIAELTEALEDTLQALIDREPPQCTNPCICDPRTIPIVACVYCKAKAALAGGAK